MVVRDPAEPEDRSEVLFADPLADALWVARSRGEAVEDVTRFGEVPLRRGRAIADELYQAFSSSGQEQVAWKLGATGADIQSMLGTDAPFVAPVYGGWVFNEHARVRRQSFVAPRFEFEIAVVVGGGESIVRPCIEIADCRFHGWKVDLPLAIADFGLQGCFVLGAPAVTACQSVEVSVTKDGAPLFQVPASVRVAAEIAAATAGKHGLNGLRDCVMATGTLAPALALTAGTWRANFGEWGSVEVVVEDDTREG